MTELEERERVALEVIWEQVSEGRDWRAATKWLELNFPEKYRGTRGGKRKGAGGVKPLGSVSAPDRVKLRAVE